MAPELTEIQLAIRAFVTLHPVVVTYAKESFGDRFSNNEIFDRLKISRRTGYRALSNDARIGKAAGRKPKISPTCVKAMIAHIEGGHCREVGNVWKYLANKFAPDCNPKTVQDAIKRSGFENKNTDISLDPEPTAEVEMVESPPDAAVMDTAISPIQENPDMNSSDIAALTAATADRSIHDDAVNINDEGQLPNIHQGASTVGHFFGNPANAEALRTILDNMEYSVLRAWFQALLLRFPEAGDFFADHYCQWMTQSSQQPGIQFFPGHLASHNDGGQHHNSAIQSSMLDNLQGHTANSGGLMTDPNALHHANQIGRRLAVCRRCGQTFDRLTNVMERRECAYHKGSVQKIMPDVEGTMETNPEAFIWSCCSGNGAVMGCTRAMHTTKKNRISKKVRFQDTTNEGASTAAGNAGQAQEEDPLALLQGTGEDEEDTLPDGHGALNAADLEMVEQLQKHMAGHQGRDPEDEEDSPENAIRRFVQDSGVEGHGLLQQVENGTEGLNLEVANDGEEEENSRVGGLEE